MSFVPAEIALAFTRPPHPLAIEPLVRMALEEDLGRAGDITSQLTIPAEKTATAIVVDAGAARHAAEEEEEAEAAGGSVARVPVDPEKGDDIVLKIGYGALVRGR